MTRFNQQSREKKTLHYKTLPSFELYYHIFWTTQTSGLASIYYIFLWEKLTAGVAEKHGSLLIPVTVGAGGQLFTPGILN
jgi:hypothetical protein